VAAVTIAPLETVSRNRPALRQIFHDLGPVQIANGFVGFLFAATGPVAVVFSVGAAGGLSETQLASWLFGIFVINGAITLAMTWAFRQPLCFYWTIPGAVLVGPALKHLSFPEVIGAFYATSLLILGLGLSGALKRAMQWVPMPIVMGMVAGVFLKFGLDIVRALHGDLGVAGAMLATFLLLSALPRAGKALPPIVGALIVGVVLALVTGRLDPAAISGLKFAEPIVTAPVFSGNAILELVVPLAITILVVQNAQGFAVLTQAGHAPPVSAITLACGVGGLASAAVGAVGSCLAGPTNAIITSSGERDRHYAAALLTGFISILFGLFAPTFAMLMLAAPKELVMMLGGLAMLRVLLGSFTTAFKGPFALGALTSFLVTVADLPVLHIGAAFWGFVAGLAVSWLLECHDFQKIA